MFEVDSTADAGRCSVCSLRRSAMMPRLRASQSVHTVRNWRGAAAAWDARCLRALHVPAPRSRVSGGHCCCDRRSRGAPLIQAVAARLSRRAASRDAAASPNHSTTGLALAQRAAESGQTVSSSSPTQIASLPHLHGSSSRRVWSAASGPRGPQR